MKWILVLILLAGAARAEVSREALNRQYRGLKGFTATAVQSKTSPYLIKPMISDVAISYENDRLTWSVKGQDPLQVRFPLGKSPELIGAGTLTESMPPAARAKLLATLQAVRNLILFDPRLDDDFQLAVSGNQLRITPKPNRAQVFFQEIVLDFNRDLQLQTMVLKAPDDVTQLTFSQLKWVK